MQWVAVCCCTAGWVVTVGQSDAAAQWLRRSSAAPGTVEGLTRKVPPSVRGAIQHRVQSPLLVPAERIAAWPLVTGVRQNRRMLLWGRHTPKYVRSGAFRYVVLEARDNRPSLYQRAERGNNVQWRRVWQGLPEVHQPPTLLVDNNDRLHILYVTGQGVLRHKIFAASHDGRLAYQGRVSTAPWGLNNYYMGAAYAAATNSVIVCATQFSTNIFRCGTSRAGVWTKPKNIALGIPGLFLYPNVQPTGSTSLVASGAYRPGTPHAMRIGNSIFSIDANARLLRDGRSVTYGNAQNGETFFENDIEVDNKGRVFLLVSRASHKVGVKVRPEVFLLRSRDGFGTRLRVGDVTQSASTMSAGPRGLEVVGHGAYSTSIDGGSTWSTSRYELPGYPRSHFTYNVAQVLQGRSGTAFDREGLSFLQELTERSTGLRTLVEVRISQFPTAGVRPSQKLVAKGDGRSRQR